MENKQKKKASPLTVILCILLFAALVAVGVLLLRDSGSEAQDDIPAVIGGGEPIPDEQDKPKDENVIHLPAYGGLTFAAGKKEQTETLQNPGENTCLIRISLILADGTTIDTSELVEPGYYTKPILLIAPMERGIYRDVTLKYDCFTNDENQSPLNGATCKLDITVK